MAGTVAVKVGGGGHLSLLLYLLLLSINLVTRIAIDNAICSSLNSNTVNTAMHRGKASGTAIASVSNGFDVGISANRTALLIDCMNFRSIRRHLSNEAALAVALIPSTRVVSRLIIINCNIVGHDSLANSISSVSRGTVGRNIGASLRRTVRNHVTNIRIARGSNTPNNNVSIRVHNVGSLDNGRPLCIVSNVTVDNGADSGADILTDVGPSSVAGVRILGSTSTATVCNSHTSGNIILVAAGHNRRNGTGVRCRKCIN